jgi:hypothetical protein
MTTPFAYHTQQAQRRNNESAVAKQIKNIKKSTENYREAKNSDAFLIDAVKTSATQTAYARLKLSDQQKDNLGNIRDFKSEAINLFLQASKFGIADIDVTVDKYPYVHSYARIQNNHCFSDVSVDQSDLQGVMISSRSSNFRKLINYRIALVEALIIKHSPFDDEKREVMESIYTETIEPMFDILQKGYDDFDLSRLPSGEILDWLPKYDIADAGLVVYECFKNLHKIPKTKFMLYWIAHGDVSVTPDFLSYTKKHYSESVVALSPTLDTISDIVQQTHCDICGFLDPNLFPVLNAFDAEINNDRGSAYVKGY